MNEAVGHVLLTFCLAPMAAASVVLQASDRTRTGRLVRAALVQGHAPALAPVALVFLE